MKKQKKVFNLGDSKDVAELKKQLYSNDEVKDGSKSSDTKREQRANGASEMAKLPPNCS